MPSAVLLLTQSPLTFPEVATRLLAVVTLILLNAFFVTVEFSIVSVRRSRSNQLVFAGDVQAKTVQQLQRKINSLLSTTQLGITLSSLALGWIGEVAWLIVIASVWMALKMVAEGGVTNQLEQRCRKRLRRQQCLQCGERLADSEVGRVCQRCRDHNATIVLN